MLTRRSLVRACLTALMLIGLDAARWASAQDLQKRVLVLYSTRRDAQVAIIGDRELPRLLDRGLTRGLDYYSEFIDQARFSDAAYQRSFAEFLRSKYRDVPLDVVIAMGDTPLQFVAAQRRALFAKTPIVFFTTQAVSRRPVNSTGVTSTLDFSESLKLALELQPGTRNVFVVSGADESDLVYEAAARRQLAPFASRVAITYLAGLPTDRLVSQLSALPDNSIVYYLLVNRDGTGANFHPLEYLARLSRVANAPMYCWVDSAIGQGVVGGRLKDQEAQIQLVATMAIRVLAGESAESIPISSQNLYVSQVDWRQVVRWGISEAQIPAGTLVRFREPSLWDRYWYYLLGAATLVLAQTALIAGLLVQRARRHRAEARVRDLGVRLLNAQETERAHIARELHDDVSQQMALLEMDLELLRGGVGGPAEGLASEALHRVKGVARSVHELSHRLHPAKLRLIGLASALRGLQRDVPQSSVKITFTVEDIPRSLAQEITLCLFRIAQESLLNAIKYSQARHLSVTVLREPHALQLTVADDGIGFDVKAEWGKGLGLISMKERVEAIGGRLSVRSGIGRGTRVHVTVPLAPATDESGSNRESGSGLNPYETVH
jgi:signal transduction histidine kinase